MASIAWMSRNHGLQDCRIQHVIEHKKNQVKLEKHQEIQSWHACQLLAHSYDAHVGTPSTMVVLIRISVTVDELLD